MITEATPGGGSGEPASNGTEFSPPPIPDHALVRRIGRGSYGDVWLARNLLGELRAVKLVFRDRFDEERPYQREFEGMSHYAPLSLSHPSLLRILQVGKSQRDDCFYYVMELADGADAEAKADPEAYTPRTLRQVLKQRGRLPLTETVQIADELATALDYLHHNGLVHRDIKPSNIVFVGGRARLADIGLVTRYADSLSMVGAEGYRPDSGFGTPQGDLYALGKVIYEMITGLDRLSYPRLPDLRSLPTRERQGILELNRVVLKACDHQPARRYPNAARLQSDLALLAQGTSLRLRRQLRHSSAGLAIIICALLAGLIAQSSWNRVREDIRRREVLILDATLAQAGVPVSGWSNRAAELLRQAARIRLDTGLVEHITATFADVDARPLAFRKHAGTSVAFGPNGMVAADGDGARSGWLWDSRGRPRELPSGPGQVFFNDAGRPCQFRHQHSGFEVRSLDVPEEPARRLAWPAQVPGEVAVVQLAVSVDGAQFAALVEAGDRTQWVVSWRNRSSEVLCSQLQEPATALALSPGGEVLGLGCEGGATRVCRGSTLEELARVHSQSRRSPVTSLAFGRNAWVSDSSGEAPDLSGWLLAVGDGSSGIVVWDLALREMRSVCRGSNFEVTAMAFHPDGATLATAGRAEAWLWDVATGRALLSLASEDFVMDHARGLALSPEGDRLAITTSEPGRKVFDGSLSLWAIEWGRGIDCLRGLRSRVAQIWFSPTGQRLAALSHDWQLAVWDLRRSRLEWVFSPPPGALADNASVAFLPDDAALVFAGGRHAAVFSLTQGRPIETWDLPPGFADHVLVRGGRTLLLRRQARVSSGPPQFWTISELVSHGVVRLVHQQTDARWVSYETAFDPAGRFAVVVGFDRSRQRWQEEAEMRWIDLASGEERTLPLQPRAQAVYFDSQGRWGVYILPRGEGCAVFDTTHPGQSEKYPFKFTGMSADGRWLGHTLPGKACCLIDRQAPERRLNLAIHHPASLAPVVFSPRSDLAAWGTAAGTVLVARLADIGQQLKPLEPLPPGIPATSP